MFEGIRNLFRKAGAKIGMNGSLIDVTDDNRVNMPISEYKRIAKDFRFYRNDYDSITEHVGKNIHRRKRHTVNMTKTAARRLASIVFNQKAKVSFSDEAVNNYIDEVFTDNDFYNQFETNLEKGIVAGGFAMRPYVDNGKIRIAWIRADQFYPLRSNTNNIPECAIVSKTQQIENHTVIYYSLLEFHQWDEQGNYVITNELYRSDNKSVIGYRVPLDRIYKDLQDQTNFGPMYRPLFAYFHTPGANNISLESPLGVGIVDNARGELKDINMINDAMQREIRYGKRRIVVPEQMLKIDEVHEPYFDPEDPTYIGFNGDDLKITDVTSDMRIEQLKSAMDYALRKFEVQIGLSAGTFSYDESGLKTATEVVSDNSMTYQTRSSYLTMVEKAIKELCTSILELANYNGLFKYDVANNDPKFHIYFDDGLFVDKDKQLDEDLKSTAALAMPKKQFLIRNYGLNDDEADEWLQQTYQEQREQMNLTSSLQEETTNPDGDDDVGAD